MLSPQELERRSSGSFPILRQNHGQQQSTRGGFNSSKGGRGGPNNARSNRSEYAAVGHTRDKNNATLVIESIPDDKLDDESIRGYFVKFGDIESLEVKSEKKLALITFANVEDARKAHSSPDPIFNNRFVKVYWSKSEDETDAEGGSGNGEDLMEVDKVDMEALQVKLSEAQKVHDERQAKKKEIEDQAKEIERRKADLTRMQELQKKLLFERLAKKHAAGTPTSATPATGTNGAANGTNGVSNGNNDTGDKDKEKEAKNAQQTAALKAQLEALEAEASSLGIDHSKLDEALPDFGHGGYASRGRGSFRARGNFAPRGSFPPRGRGGYRGRGVPFGARGGAMFAPKKLTLDNRTKTIIVSGIPEEHVEDLQQNLLVGAIILIHYHPHCY